MRECEYYQELMSRLLDDGLTAEEETSLREHVRTCPQCRQMFAAFTGMTNALRDDQADPPRDLARGVMERIADEADRPRRAKRSRSGARRAANGWVRLGAAACLVLIVAGGATFALRNGRESASGPESAEVLSDGEALSRQAAAPAKEVGADEPMMISAQDAQAAPDGAEAAGDTAAVQAPTPTPEPDQPLPVYDAARTRIGVIPPENRAAFEALITDAGQADGSFEYLLKVQFRGKTYAFATDPDSGELVWWEEPSTQPLRSPGTLADLHGLITMDAPALPQ